MVLKKGLTFLREKNAFLDVIRIYLGIALMVKAYFFAIHQETLMDLINSSGNVWGYAAFIAHYVIIAHIAGGFFLALGLLTRIAALIQVPALLGAVFFVHMPLFSEMGGTPEFELSALVLFLLVLFSIRWSGELSVDYYVKTHRDK